MDGQRFDELVRSLAGGTSRRGALKRLAAGAGALLAAARLDGADAAVCRRFRDICRKPDDCCSNHCGPPDKYRRRYCGVCPLLTPVPCGTESCCSPSQTCFNGACCDRPCGEGPNAVCCTNFDVCLTHFSDDQGVTYSCCNESLVCIESNTCCSLGERCVTSSICCLTENICESQSEGTECCGEGAVCTFHGCCESTAVCTAPNGTLFCCGEGNTDNCTNLGCDQNGACEPCEEECETEGETCCNGCCVPFQLCNLG